MPDAKDSPTGMVHVNEDEMRAAGDGVFSGKARGSAPSNKALAGSGENKALSAMTKPELLEAAKGIPGATEDDNKAELIAKIEKARAANA